MRPRDGNRDGKGPRTRLMPIADRRSCHSPQLTPFSIRLLDRDSDGCVDASGHANEQLKSLLPAAYRTESDDLVAPAGHIAACLARELDLRRLINIRRWWWIAGRPTPPRPLHYQLLLNRDILVVERLDMHLVWTTRRIFIKPMPRFLLEPRFWTEYLCCKKGCVCSIGKYNDLSECEGHGLRKRALGFLFSYAALITHESDFYIARDNRLLPPEVEWSAWRTFVDQLDTEHIYPNVDPRFHYGELRLSRLNNIYFLSQTPLRPYMRRWNQYEAFLQDNFAWLAGTTVYAVVALTAMQVGLATNTLKDNDAFQSASSFFTVFSILGPLICGGLIVLVFGYFFVYNWVITVRYKESRLRRIRGPMGRA